MSYWSVTQTEPQREHSVRVQLMRAGFDTYAPRIKINRHKTAPLFPTYIFTRIVDRWYPVKWTIGVTRVLMAGDEPARVPEVVIQDLRGTQGRDGLIKLPAREPFRGQRMQIVRGSFTGHFVIFQGMTSHERQRVLLDFLGQAVTLELPVRDVIVA